VSELTLDIDVLGGGVSEVPSFVGAINFADPSISSADTNEDEVGSIVTTLKNQTNDNHISMTYCFWMIQKVPNILLQVSGLKLRLHLRWFFGR
jgi:hypothetical protein